MKEALQNSDIFKKPQQVFCDAGIQTGTWPHFKHSPVLASVVQQGGDKLLRIKRPQVVNSLAHADVAQR